MIKKNFDENMPQGKLTRVRDFLPPPSELVMPEDNVKITIFLKRSSVHFFKKKAQQYHTKYQRMMREVLDQYACHHKLEKVI